MSVENLKLVDEKLVGFLGRHEAMRKENAALVARLTEREQEYAALVERVRQYERERTEMRAILDKILSRFEGLDLQ
jgi:predicted nuclease with TOPRIM domain